MKAGKKRKKDEMKQPPHPTCILTHLDPDPVFACGPECPQEKCGDRSPKNNLPCTKLKGHDATHRNGAVTWPDQPGVPRETAEDRFRITLNKQDMTEHVLDIGLERSNDLSERILRDWWMTVAETEIDRTVPKAVEYSATDLADIGHVLARTAGRTVDDEEAAELGVFFYLQGKLSRWAGAIAQGKRPSDDTIFDIGVYCRMAQRIRHAGGWPGVHSGQGHTPTGIIFNEAREYPIKQQTYGMEPQ